MVTRNQHGGTELPEWWNDLPPSVRRRFTCLDRSGEPDRDGQEDRVVPPQRDDYHLGILRDLSRLALMFVVVALANLVFLLIALSFLSRPGPLPQ